MERNIFKKAIIFLSLVSLLFLNPAFLSSAQAIEISQDEIQKVSKESLLNEIKILLEEYYLEPERLKNIDWGRVYKLEEKEAIKSMFSQLDFHSVYLNPSNYKMTLEESEKEFGGIGIKLILQPDHSDDPKNENIKWPDPNDNNCLGFSTVISDILDDGPAKKAGLIPGDIIIQIDDKDMKGKCPPEITEKIRGEPGLLVKIIVIRKGKEIAFEIIREIIKNDPVNSFLFEDKEQKLKIGYLKISNFDVDGTADFLTKKIIELAAGGTDNLVLDLRDNLGGLLIEASLVANIFLEPTIALGEQKLITKTKDKNGEVLFAPYSISTTKFLPLLIVLVNEKSASASEIVAAALQDNKAAIIVGTPTFGKASVQTLFPLANGGCVIITTDRFFRPNGETLQGYGVIPDIIIEKNEIPQKKVKREKDLKGVLKPIGEAPTLPFSDIPEKFKNDFQLMRTLEIIRSFEIIKR